MIVEERMKDFINSLDTGHGSVCDQIGEEARAGRVPVIRRETAALLETLVALKRPQAILEVGAAVGYSALVMCGAMPEGCHITTIENYEKRIRAARENIRRAGREADVTLLEGSADEILASLDGPYDLIFMDAAKGQYLAWLPELLRLLSAGGLLISDNVLQDGDIIESRYAVERRNRTIHSRMREYLYALKHTEGLTSSIVPIGDGVAISVRAGCMYLPAAGADDACKMKLGGEG